MGAVKVNVIHHPKGNDLGVNRPGRDHRSAPTLELIVAFERPMVSQIQIHPRSRRVNRTGGREVGQVTNRKTATLVVDLPSARQKIDIRPHEAIPVVDPNAAQKTLLAADRACVNRVDAPNLRGWMEAVQREECKIEPRT